jgi:hypothetical protein
MSVVVVVSRSVNHEHRITGCWKRPALPTADLAARMMKNPAPRSDGLSVIQGAEPLAIELERVYD